MKKLKVIKVSKKKNKVMTGYFDRANKEATEKIDKLTLSLLFGKYGKNWVLKNLTNN